MVNRNLIANIEDDDIDSQMSSLFAGTDEDFDKQFVENEVFEQNSEIDLNKIVQGKILRVDSEKVLIDVGFKSEGSVDRSEWNEVTDPPPEVGQQVHVYVEDIEDEFGETDDPFGLISISKTKADHILHWESVIKKVKEGDVVLGQVTKKIKGGLLVEIGVPVFLPASQVDIRRPGDIGDYIGRYVQCEVLKIDTERRNIVVSRRALIESERKYIREILLRELKERDIRKGIVKNIADFGAFVDLGGIDGLLHITDMSHARINHPSQMVSMDQEIDVMILNIDREKEKIALGLKQMQSNPWDDVEEKYPIGGVFNGEVVNVMSYGAFVKLEDGIEGLVHISEMSWVKRINHPNEVVQIGDEIEVAVLGIDRKGEQMSLGMKQTQNNPWDNILDRYPIDGTVKGNVRNLTNYGAFIELEEGIDGLLHVSDMSWTRKISHPNEMLEKGQEVECKILAVDPERRRIALGMKQLDNDPWATDIPAKYQPGQLIKGKVTKITNFGVFVGLEDGLEGLLHISELADDKIEDAQKVVNVGDELEVKVLRVDTEERKIGLSRKRVDWTPEEEAKEAQKQAAQQKEDSELKGGLGDSGPLIKTSENGSEDNE
ncbi:MAG: 30S ribosomal protein S1 [Planctomycetota bacterium]|nr:30S ribosomal protein S1 [Planctomycetota bacterium]